MNELQSKIDALRLDYKKRREGEKEDLKGFCEQREKLRKELMQHLRPATRNDYAEWLKGYILTNKSPRVDVIEDKFPEDRYYVALDSFDSALLEGSEDFYIILPVGVKIKSYVRSSSCWPDKVFYMDKFEMKAYTTYLYDDIKFDDEEAKQ
jgi:hypothetical protein